MGGSGSRRLLQPGAAAPQHFQQTGVASGPRILGEYNPCHSTLQGRSGSTVVNRSHPTIADGGSHFYEHTPVNFTHI